MAKVAEYHSADPQTVVWHNNSKCVVGNNIEKYNWRAGRGDKKRLCERCHEHNQKGE